MRINTSHPVFPQATTTMIGACAAPKLLPPLRTFATLIPSARASPLSASGTLRAALRFHASNLPKPLVVDPYSGCFLADLSSPPPEPPETSGYVLATAFIDGKLLDTARAQDDLRQVVLLTDGMDTRPYRLQWPRSTLIFDVSPVEVFREASLLLQGVGAKPARNCRLLHIPSESSDLRDVLCQKGFSGSSPSIWTFQGLPLSSLEKFEEILSVVSALAMEGCIFLGELPTQLLEIEFLTKDNLIKWTSHIFMRHGLRVDVMDYDKIGMKLRGCPLPVDHDSILFIARQLRYSDAQMEKWRMEFQRIEEEGDEEGFEDMIA